MSANSKDVLLEVRGVRLDEGAPEINLMLKTGDSLAVTGGNGAGKSLLLSVMLGQHDVPGEVFIGGRRVEARQGRRKSLGSVGLMLQGNGLLRDLTVRENVALPGRVRGKYTTAVLEREVDVLLGLVGCSRLAGVFPSELSGGEARRVALARALAGGSRLLLMDEPMAGLTASAREQLVELVCTLKTREVIEGLVIFTEDEKLARRLTTRRLELVTEDSMFGIPRAIAYHEIHPMEDPNEQEI